MKFFPDSLLTKDTQVIWTLWHAPLVSVLTSFHENFFMDY